MYGLVVGGPGSLSCLSGTVTCATRANDWSSSEWRVQGYLTHKKQHSPRTPQEDFAYGPMLALGGGLFLMSEVPL